MFKPSPKRIRARMAKAGIASYQELSARSGVCVNTISRLNNGGSARLPTLQRIATALNCNTVDIIEKGADHGDT